MEENNSLAHDVTNFGDVWPNFQSVSFARKMAAAAEVAARKYGRLIEAVDTLYANSTGAQKEWIDNNWKSILDGMVERGEEMIQGWKAEPDSQDLMEYPLPNPEVES